jgi:hypothetical protein
MKRLAALVLVAVVAPLWGVACGSSPTSPSQTATTDPVPVLASCATWVNTLRATGVAAGAGSVATQRETLYSDGGGVKAVGGNRYWAAWFPANWATSSPRRVMVDLHGTGGAPETEWTTDWRTIFKARNWAWIGLKYVDDSTGNHDNEQGIYGNLKTLLTDIAASCDFGSRQCFLKAIRAARPTRFRSPISTSRSSLLQAMGSNSGAWTIGGPLTTATMQGVVNRGETTGYAGTKFWMYCGARDLDHGYPMCDEMNIAKTFILNYGGAVEKLYEDPPVARRTRQERRRVRSRCSLTSSLR